MGRYAHRDLPEKRNPTTLVPKFLARRGLWNTIGMPLKLRRANEQFPKAGWPPSDDHLVVMHDEHVIGTLRRIDAGPQRNNWSWSITGCYVPPGVMTLHGTADTKDEAKAAFGKTLRSWLDHIGADDLTGEVLAKYGIGSGHNPGSTER
jgi:hypothetical protein